MSNETVFVDHKSDLKQQAILLIGAAKELGYESSVVRTQRNGFLVPADVLERAESDVTNEDADLGETTTARREDVTDSEFAEWFDGSSDDPLPIENLPEIPAGDFDDRVDWIKAGEDTEVQRARAQAVFISEKKSGDVDVDELKEILAELTKVQEPAPAPKPARKTTAAKKTAAKKTAASPAAQA